MHRKTEISFKIKHIPSYFIQIWLHLPMHLAHSFKSSDFFTFNLCRLQYFYFYREKNHACETVLDLTRDAALLVFQMVFFHHYFKSLFDDVLFSHFLCVFYRFLFSLFLSKHNVCQCPNLSFTYVQIDPQHTSCNKINAQGNINDSEKIKQSTKCYRLVVHVSRCHESLFNHWNDLRKFRFEWARMPIFIGTWH